HRPAGGAVQDVAAHRVGSGVHGVETARRLPAEADSVTLSIIIVTYNSAKVIGACLDSLAADVSSGLAEVICVDNASADDSVPVVRERYPWAILLPGRENLGYSKGVNLGIQRARGRYLLLLNPDTVVRR